ncbi:MAG: glycosyltransferase family 4 protein [Methylocystis sp.]
MTVSKPLRIAIATGGRFHVLDLARELDALGHEVRFYSYVPKARALKFGLPARCHVSLLPLMWPLVAWERLQPKAAPEMREKLLAVALNRAVMARLHSCDIFIGMSGLILEAARFAKSKFGARIYVERGSQHIVSQARILEHVPGAQTPSCFAIERELAGYELADRIAVASGQVVDSFLDEDPSLASKLFKNPYGVDLKQFPQRKLIPPGPPTVLFVGAWTYQKGADVLSAAMERLPGVRLIHVGNRGEVSLPVTEYFVHYDSVPQWRLSEFYAQAHVFALASRQEGLALVQLQALASGLPLVCTDRTGGADLNLTPALAARIRVVPSGDANLLAKAISSTLADKLSPLAESDRQILSWRGYGMRYARELESQESKSH